MGVVDENRFQPRFLAAVEQRVSGAQGASYPVERIPGAAAVPAGALLDTLPTQIQLGASQGDDVEGDHHRGSLWQDLGGRSLVAAEPVHGHDFDVVAKRWG